MLILFQIYNIWPSINFNAFYAFYPLETAGFPPNPNYEKNKSHPPPLPPPHQSHCAQSSGGYMSGSYGSKSPSNRRYDRHDHEQQQSQHQSRRKHVRESQQLDQMREHHSSFPSSSRNVPYQAGGAYHQEQHIEIHRAPDLSRGRTNHHRSLSATRGSGNKNNQYHHAASWVRTNT